VLYTAKITDQRFIYRAAHCAALPELVGHYRNCRQSQAAFGGAGANQQRISAIGCTQCALTT
jgi:hypothetical protein